MELTSTQKGTIAEQAVILEAIRLCVPVLRPVGEGLRYDLAFDLPGGLTRVQCKWARRAGDVLIIQTGTCRFTPRAGYVRTVYAPDEIDAVAAWSEDTRRCYYLPVDVVAGRSVVHLRLAAARNNQRELITMAADFEFGAVAQLGGRERIATEPELCDSQPTIPGLR